MKGRFLDNGDIELDDGTIIHDPYPVSMCMPMFSTNSEMSIGFTAEYVISENPSVEDQEHSDGE